MSEHTDDTKRQTYRDRVATWWAGRPVTGAGLLLAASAMLVLVAVRPATVQITDTSLRGPLAGTGAVVLFGAGTLALARPRRATAAGGLGIVTVFVTLPAIVSLGSVGAVAEMLLATALFGAAGGIVCAGRQPGRQSSPSPVKRRAGMLAVVFAFMIVVSSGAATAGQFPQQRDAYGGFTVKLDTLDAEEYDFNPNCRALLDDCNDITVDTRTQSSVPVGRQKLTGVEGTNFVLSQNLQQQDGSYVNLQLRGSQITSTGDRGFDAYVSEYYNDYAKADLSALGLQVPIDELVDLWMCDVRGEAEREDPGGFGTLDDTRLGIDATPVLEDGENIRQLAHQVGTSNTVIQDFELEVNETRDTGYEIAEDEPLDPEDCA